MYADKKKYFAIKKKKKRYPKIVYTRHKLVYLSCIEFLDILTLTKLFPGNSKALMVPLPYSAVEGKIVISKYFKVTGILNPALSQLTFSSKMQHAPLLCTHQ